MRSVVAKANAIKSSVKNNNDIETVVLYHEENEPVLHDGPDMDPEPISHPIAHSPHVSDKNPQIDSVSILQLRANLLKGIYLLLIELVKQFIHCSLIFCLTRYVEWK